MKRHEERQLKALFFILLLAGHEATRISEQASLVDGEKWNRKPDAEKEFQMESSRCKFKLSKGGCAGFGCKYRSLPLDLPPPSSQSCRLSDAYMLHDKRQGHYLQLHADLLKAKASKYRQKKCADRWYDLKCFRRLKHMIRSLQFISQATKDAPDSTRSKAQASLNTAMEEFSSTLGSDGDMGRKLVSKLTASKPNLKDPDQLVRVLALVVSLLKGTEAEKKAARNAIDEMQTSPGAEIRLPDELELALADGQVAASQDVEDDIGSEDVDNDDEDGDGEDTSPLQQAVSKFEASTQMREEMMNIDVDNALEEIEGSLEGGNQSSMLQVSSEGKVFSVLAMVVYVGLVVAAVFYLTIPIVAMMTYWALFALVGCSAATLAVNAFKRLRYGRGDEVWNPETRNVTVKLEGDTRWIDIFSYAKSPYKSVIRLVRSPALKGHIDVGDEVVAVHWFQRNATTGRWSKGLISGGVKNPDGISKNTLRRELKRLDRRGRKNATFQVRRFTPKLWGVAGSMSCMAKMMWLPVFVPYKAYNLFMHQGVVRILRSPWTLYKALTRKGSHAEVTEDDTPAHILKGFEGPRKKRKKGDLQK